MQRLTMAAKQSINKLSETLQERLGERATLVNQLQEDPETLASLCEIEFATKKALVWFRPNGSASGVNGVRILLSGGVLPKRNPNLSSFVQSIS